MIIKRPFLQRINPNTDKPSIGFDDHSKTIKGPNVVLKTNTLLTFFYYFSSFYFNTTQFLIELMKYVNMFDHMLFFFMNNVYTNSSYTRF